MLTAKAVSAIKALESFAVVGPHKTLGMFHHEAREWPGGYFGP